MYFPLFCCNTDSHQNEDLRLKESTPENNAFNETRRRDSQEKVHGPSWRRFKEMPRSRQLAIAGNYLRLALHVALLFNGSMFFIFGLLGKGQAMFQNVFLVNALVSALHLVISQGVSLVAPEQSLTM